MNKANVPESNNYTGGSGHLPKLKVIGHTAEAAVGILTTPSKGIGGVTRLKVPEWPRGAQRRFSSSFVVSK